MKMGSFDFSLTEIWLELVIMHMAVVVPIECAKNALQTRRIESRTSKIKRNRSSETMQI